MYVCMYVYIYITIIILINAGLRLEVRQRKRLLLEPGMLVGHDLEHEARRCDERDVMNYVCVCLYL